jgi:peptidoglycan glycosyltransferase
MRLSRSHVTKGIVFSGLLAMVFVGGWAIGLRTQSKHSVFHNNFLHPYLTKEALQAKIAKLKNEDIYKFKQNEVSLEGFDEPVVFDYAFDPAIQSEAEELLARYKPDLGAMVAMDASTGRILAMVGENRAFEMEGNPAISMSYPAASIFKVITATAALEHTAINPTSMMAYEGRNHTLYKSQVLKEKVSGWKRTCTLKEAFAKSLNPVFGRLGVFSLGKESIQNCSNKFVFNENIPSEFPITSSRSANPNGDYELAEMASGYTQNNVMTPLHGALIAAAVANDGVMMEPYFMNAAYLKSGKPIYRSEPSVLSQVMSPETANELKTLMRATITSGTSRTSFRGFFKGRFSELDVGGKTGHLTDKNLGGRIDWFVGFAQAHGRKIAVSVMTMHKKYWTVKSSYLARRTIETAFTVKKVAQK